MSKIEEIRARHERIASSLYRIHKDRADLLALLDGMAELPRHRLEVEYDEIYPVVDTQGEWIRAEQLTAILDK